MNHHQTKLAASKGTRYLTHKFAFNLTHSLSTKQNRHTNHDGDGPLQIFVSCVPCADTSDTDRLAAKGLVSALRLQLFALI